MSSVTNQEKQQTTSPIVAELATFQGSMDMFLEVEMVLLTR